MSHNHINIGRNVFCCVTHLLSQETNLEIVKCIIEILMTKILIIMLLKVIICGVW